MCKAFLQRASIAALCFAFGFAMVGILEYRYAEIDRVYGPQ